MHKLAHTKAICQNLTMKLPPFKIPHVKFLLQSFWKEEHRPLLIFSGSMLSILFLSIIGLSLVFGLSYQHTTTTLSAVEKQKLAITKELTTLKNQDQYKRNETLQATISAIEKTYSQSINLYQTIMDLQAQKVDTTDDLKLFTNTLALLSTHNYASASTNLALLASNIQIQQNKLAAATVPVVVQTANAPSSNTPPGSGYSVQTVSTDRGNFTVSIIAADLSSTKVVVDTASDGDCNNNCPTLPLSDYIARSGAYAGINGTYFCPADYPSCAGKTGSFDLLVMNKNKVYFNSSNNVYSTNPAVIFGNGFIRFVPQAEQWGRDTSVDGVISNFPLLVYSGNITYSDSNDAKFNNLGTRGFVANKGNTVFIGFVYNANMTDSAHVMKSLSMDNAMNLDEGGSTALWFGGYKAGPGRNIPNAVLFIRK